MRRRRGAIDPGARRPETLTPGMYSCGNQMLLARLLRSMVSSSRDDVAPSTVKGALCLPTVSTNCGLFVHMHIKIGKPHVERIVTAAGRARARRGSVNFRNSVMRGPMRSRLTFHSSMIALIGIDRGEVVMEAPAQQHTLHDRVRVVGVPFREFPPDLIVGRRFFLRGRRLCGCCGGQTSIHTTKRSSRMRTAYERRVSAMCPGCFTGVNSWAVNDHRPNRSKIAGQRETGHTKGVSGETPFVTFLTAKTRTAERAGTGEAFQGRRCG